MRNVFVLGSINMDFTMLVQKMPMVGETKSAHGFQTNQGGKGANQAIACKKLGCENVYMIGAVGSDATGKTLLDELNKNGLNTEAVKVVDGASGSAMIILDESIHDNVILVDAGSNKLLDTDYVLDFLDKHAKKGDILVSQLETNLEPLYAGFKKAKEIGMYTFLNPAPAAKVDEVLFKYTDIIVPNETELKLFTGIDINSLEDVSKGYQAFKKLGVKTLILTLGSEGSYYCHDNEIIHHGIRKVHAVDTTAAGDTFIGALVYRLANGYGLNESMDYAAVCSSITVSRMGAGKSIPTKAEVDEVLKSIK